MSDDRARLRAHFRTLLGVGESGAYDATIDAMVEAAIDTLGDEAADTLVSGVRATDDTLPAGSVDAAPDLTLPVEVAGRYLYGRELGRGGLGRVVEAYDRALGRTVAIKELLQTGDPRAEARFLTEARITGQLSHANVIPVHELGRHPDGQLYYVMRKVGGGSLRHALERATTLSERLALLPQFINLCQAVAFAHEHGVLHRDLKPDNVMVSHYGTTLVVDWGLAKARGEEDELGRDAVARPIASPVHTLDGQVMGTPAYMSPEQARGATSEIDERSDVWSLGAILFELLTGRPPFLAETLEQVLLKVLVDPVPDPADLVEGAPPDLCAVARRCLTRDREERVASVDEMLEALDAFVQGDLEKRAESLEELLDAHASPAVSRALRSVHGAGLERRHLGVLMTDLHNFSGLLERADRGAFTELLTPYYDLVVEEVERHGGHVNKLIGDSTLCFFNAPDPVEHPARAAVEAAARIAERFASEIHAGLPGELRSCAATISVHAGEAWVGRIGSARRIQYTAFGDTINVPYEINAALSEPAVVITDLAWQEAVGSGIELSVRDAALIFRTKLGPTRCRQLA